jgi:hypothetical protein
MALKNKTQEESVSTSNCRAKARGASGLVDCLALTQAGLCRFSLPFGIGYFCNHPNRNRIVVDTEKIENESGSKSGITETDK